MPTNIPSKTESKVTEGKEYKVISIESGQTPINFMDGLALLFIGLKLGTNRLDDWTWIEVLIPLWGPLMLQWFLRLIEVSFKSPEEDKEQ